VCQHFKKSVWLRHPLPYFLIDFSGIKYDISTFEFIRSNFLSAETLIKQDTISYLSKKDTFILGAIRNSRDYESMTQIWHD